MSNFAKSISMSMNFSYRIVVVSMVMSSLLLSSCGEYTKLTKSDDAQLKYDKAFEYYEKEDYYKAATLLESSVPSFRGTEKGEKGLFTMAMAHFKNKDYVMAKSYFATYCKGYPSGEYAEEAKFHIGYCYYLDSPDVKLDQTSTQKAIDELLSFSQLYPNSSKLPRVLDLIKELQEKLAEKEYLNAKLYYDLGDYMGNNYLSAVVTATNAIKKFPDTQYKEELSFLILKSKYMQAVKSVETKKEDRYRDTIDEYYNFVRDFPESDHKKEAEKYFKKSKVFLDKTDIKEE